MISEKVLKEVAEWVLDNKLRPSHPNYDCFYIDAGKCGLQRYRFHVVAYPKTSTGIKELNPGETHRCITFDLSTNGIIRKYLELEGYDYD